jgi:NADPH:quinone reductase-like Zn-dependent oxidoreductase
VKAPAQHSRQRTTMQAIVQHSYGAAAALRLESIETPRINDDEVLVRVHAAAINHADWGIMTGRPYLLRLAFGLRRPRVEVRGRDLAGTVEAVGRDVTRFRPGDEVYGEIDSGSFAPYARAPDALLDVKPTNLTFEQAAAVPLAGVTALQGLRDIAAVKPGDSVLINGASGGVGTFAVQIAKALGAEVTGVCSTRNLDLARSLGADHVIDYTEEDFTRSGRRYDLIFDLVGNHALSACRRCLTPAGTLVLSSGRGGRVLGPIGRITRAFMLSPFVSQTMRPLLAASNPERLAALTALIEAGKLTPAIDRTYALSEVPEAMRYFEEEHARAKIVITVPGSEGTR